MTARHWIPLSTGQLCLFSRLLLGQAGAAAPRYPVGQREPGAGDAEPEPETGRRQEHLLAQQPPRGRAEPAREPDSADRSAQSAHTSVG